jgi:hypothetical protein
MARLPAVEGPHRLAFEEAAAERAERAAQGRESDGAGGAAEEEGTSVEKASETIFEGK